MTSKKRTEHTRKRSRPVSPKKTKINTNMIIIIVIVAIIIIVAGSLFIFLGNDTDNGENNTQTTGNSIAVIDTSKGIIKVELFEDKAPKTCENFIKLVNDGFYNGMIFHRIMDDFMIQAGNTFPDGTTKSSPYGNIEFESDPELLHEDGSISMASTGYGVGGSAQFFICDGAQSGLDGGYAVFGKAIEGIEVVRDIANDPHDNSSPAGGGKPLEDILIKSITIE
jgi:peptidyl-prolyl cis-trans isomerase A (cyclophilin A)